ncbi:MAG: NUDIX hydrolase [Desulfobacterales bacterium]
MNYCSECGESLTYFIPPGDDRSRYCCESCKTIHYQNPKKLVGCIPEMEDKILFCRRAIEPCYGKWTLPAGYLENGETVSAGARRETFEEARARVEILAPYALYNICHVNQVYLMFRARLMDHDFRPGDESLEVRLFSESEVPWDDIAFRVMEETLVQFFKDRTAGLFPFYVGNISKKSKRSIVWGM